MTAPLGTQRTPGIVIFVSVLHFLSAAFAALFAGAAMLALIFGNILGVSDWAARKLAQIQTETTFTWGVNMLFVLILIFSLIALAFFLSMGLGLLRGRKFAWFAQLAMSVLGLAGFPVGTVINGIILIFFFHPSVRDYFQV